MSDPGPDADGDVVADGETAIGELESDATVTATEAGQGVHNLGVTLSADGSIERPPAGVDVAPVPMSVYRFIAEHGRGGLGRVMRARDKRTDRLVAIKEMLVDTESAAARFRREALITANLQHPGIVPVYEVGRWPSGKPFYAMKLVEGRSLREVIDEAETFEDRIGLLHHVTAVAEALAYAHSKSIIHRDLKPSNILVGAFGETVVIDWGLAKDLAAEEGDDAVDSVVPATGDSGLTRAGSVIGTPAYMAPEQARGEPADERSDVYALGCVLYHVLTGDMPYAGSDSIVDDLLAGPPVSLGERLPDVPADLRSIVDRAMARQPGHRYPSAAEVAEELRRFETGKLVSAHVYSARQLVFRWVRRYRAVLAVALVAAIGLAVLGVVSVQRIAGERDVANSQRQIAEESEQRATEAQAVARARLADVHAELGRREVAASEPFRAVAHLAEAARIRGELDPGLRYLTGRAMESVSALTAAAQLDSELVWQSSTVNHRWVAFATADSHVELWDLEVGAMAWRARMPAPVRSVVPTVDGRLFVATDIGPLAFRDGKDVTPSSWGNDSIDRIAVDQERGRVYFARRDGRVELRSLIGGAIEATWSALDGAIDGFGVLAGGKRLVCVADDASATVLLDTSSGRVVATIADTRYIESAPGGGLFAISRPETTEVLDAFTGARVSSLPSGPAVQVLMPDDNRVMTATIKPDVVLWNARTGQRIRDLGSHNPGSPAYGTSDPRRRVLVTNYRPGSIRVWDLGDGSVVGDLRYPHAPIVGFAIGRHLVAAERDGRRYVWDAESLRNREALVGHSGRARRLAFASDGRIATGSEDKTARLWSAKGAPLATLAEHRERVTWVEFSADDSKLATASADGVVRIFDTKSHQLVSELTGHTAAVQQVRFLPASKGGDQLASIGEDGTARIWKGGKQVCQVALPKAQGRGLELSGDGSRALAYAEGDRAVVFSPATCRVEALLETRQTLSLRGLISPDGEVVALAGKLGGFDHDGTAALFHVARPKERIDLAGLAGLAAGLTFSPDSERVVVGDVDGRIVEYDAKTGKKLREFEGVETVVGDLAFSADGALLVVGSDPGELAIFAADSGELLERIDGLGAGIYQLRVSPDGRRVATAALDLTPRLWSLPRYDGTIDELGRVVACEIEWGFDEGGRLTRRPKKRCR